MSAVRAKPTPFQLLLSARPTIEQHVRETSQNGMPLSTQRTIEYHVPEALQTACF